MADTFPSPSPTQAHEEVLRALVEAVTRCRLTAPALFLLEAVRPCRLLVQQGLWMAHPLLRPWFGERALVWADLLEDPAALERALRQAAGQP